MKIERVVPFIGNKADWSTFFLNTYSPTYLSPKLDDFMKILKVIACLAILIAVSCKKDRDAEITEALVGHWHISSFEPESANDISSMAKEVIAKLAEAECFPLEYSFTSSGKVSHIDKMGFLEPRNGDNGVEVDCYFENVFKDGTFTISSNVLTIKYENQTDVFNTIVTDDTLTIERADFILNNETVTGELIFSREEF